MNSADTVIDNKTLKFEDSNSIDVYGPLKVLENYELTKEEKKSLVDLRFDVDRAAYELKSKVKSGYESLNKKIDEINEYGLYQYSESLLTSLLYSLKPARKKERAKMLEEKKLAWGSYIDELKQLFTNKKKYWEYLTNTITNTTTLRKINTIHDYGDWHFTLYIFMLEYILSKEQKKQYRNLYYKQKEKINPYPSDKKHFDSYIKKLEEEDTSLVYSIRDLTNKYIEAAELLLDKLHKLVEKYESQDFKQATLTPFHEYKNINQIVSDYTGNPFGGYSIPTTPRWVKTIPVVVVVVLVLLVLLVIYFTSNQEGYETHDSYDVCNNTKFKCPEENFIV